MTAGPRRRRPPGRLGRSPRRWSPLLREPGLPPYLVANAVSMCGTGMQFVTTSWLVLLLSGSKHSVAIVLVCSALPGALLSPLFGVLADRLDRRRLAVAMDGLRLVVFLGVAAAGWDGALRAWHLYLVAFVVACADQTWNVATLALVRERVRPSLLLAANAATSASVQGGTLVGAAAGGAVIAALSPEAAIVLNAASFGVSGLCLVSMRPTVPRPVPPAPADVPAADVPAVPSGASRPGRAGPGVRAVFAGFAADLRAGARYLRGHPELVPVYGLLLILTSTVKLINVLLAPFTTTVLHAGPTALGLVDAAFGVGALLGNAVLLATARRIGGRPVLIGGIVTLGTGLALFGAATGVPFAIAGYLVIGAAYPVRILCLTAAQDLTDLAFQGRVHAAFTTFMSLTSLLVFTLAAVLGDVLSTRWLYEGQALLVFSGLLLARRLHPAGPRPPRDDAPGGEDDERPGAARPRQEPEGALP